MGIIEPRPHNESNEAGFSDVAFLEETDPGNWLGKVEFMIAQKGFAPHSLPELHRSHYLASPALDAGGAAEYISLVTAHLSDDGQRRAGIKEIAETMIGYYQDSSAIMKSLRTLGTELVTQPAVHLEDAYQNPLLQSALSALVRQEDTSFMILHIGSTYDYDYADMDDELLRAKWRFLVETHSTPEAMMEIIHGTAHIERRRQQFWDEQIIGQPATADKPRRLGLYDVDDDDVRALLRDAGV